jgi:hypothetical protein
MELKQGCEESKNKIFQNQEEGHSRWQKKGSKISDEKRPRD